MLSKALIVALLVLPVAVRAQEEAEHAGHAAGAAQKTSAEAATGASEPAPPLYTNLGSLHHSITTSSGQAQAFFDQGMRLVFAFNHAEAIRAFKEASRLDPKAPMPHWGVAYALGPNINAPMEGDAEKQAYVEVQKALELAPNGNEVERAYITALSKRYSADGKGDRTALDKAYSDAMREVARAHPDDLDAATLFAESIMDISPWNYWGADAKPLSGTEEMLSTLQSVLARDPNHPGACHYYIHAVELPYPEKALPCADRLAGLMPGAGHLVHMPAHIYLRLGMYDRAAETNVHAAATDEGYIADQSPDGIYPVGYYSHNLHFLGFAAAMEGRSAEAIDASRRLVENVTFDVARKLPPLELWTSVPYWTLARFGHWQEILEEPAPPSDLRFTTAQWHFARGLALAATKRLEDAKVEVDSLQAVLRATPPDAPIGFHHKAKDLLQISTDVLAADIADKSGRTDEAIKLYQDAVRAQDALLYDEPPPFYYPVRQSLGAALLEAGRAKEAEAVYREDLKLFPKNGWSLYGLAQSLKAQGKAGEAAAADKEFKEAWARADVKLTASAF